MATIARKNTDSDFPAPIEFVCILVQHGSYPVIQDRSISYFSENMHRNHFWHRDEESLRNAALPTAINASVITCLDHFRDERAPCSEPASHSPILVSHKNVFGIRVLRAKKWVPMSRQDWRLVFSCTLNHPCLIASHVGIWVWTPSRNLTGALFRHGRHCFCGTFAKLSRKFLCKSTKKSTAWLVFGGSAPLEKYLLGPILCRPFPTWTFRLTAIYVYVSLTLTPTPRNSAFLVWWSLHFHVSFWAGSLKPLASIGPFLLGPWCQLRGRSFGNRLETLLDIPIASNYRF